MRRSKKIIGGGYFHHGQMIFHHESIIGTIRILLTSDRRRQKSVFRLVRLVPEDVPQFVKDYYDYYKTPHGYHPRSLNSNGGWNKTSALSFINMPIHPDDPIPIIRFRALRSAEALSMVGRAVMRSAFRGTRSGSCRRFS